jgi:hypothetical protein
VIVEDALDRLITELLFEGDKITVVLNDGFSFNLDYSRFPRLVNATDKQRINYRLIARGDGVSWEDIDEDLSLNGMLRDLREKRMPTKFNYEFYKELIQNTPIATDLMKECGVELITLIENRKFKIPINSINYPVTDGSIEIKLSEQMNSDIFITPNGIIVGVLKFELSTDYIEFIVNHLNFNYYGGL